MTAIFAPPDLSSRPFNVIVSRAMAATRAVLDRAWTGQFDRWFAVPGTVLMTGEVNSVFFFETQSEQTRRPHCGSFLRLERDLLVQLTWLTPATDGFETIVAVDLVRNSAGGTQLQLNHAGFLNEELRKRHEQAWPIVLERPDQRIATAP